MLFHISQQVLRGHNYDQFSDDVADVWKCISVLEYCAQVDEASRCYLGILRPFRELLSRSPGKIRDMLQPPESLHVPPTSPQSQWGSMYSVFMDIDSGGRGASSFGSISTPVPSTKRTHSEYAPACDNPQWIDFHSPLRINAQQPSVNDRKNEYSEKDMEDLEVLLRRVS